MWENGVRYTPTYSICMYIFKSLVYILSQCMLAMSVDAFLISFKFVKPHWSYMEDSMSGLVNVTKIESLEWYAYIYMYITYCVAFLQGIYILSDYIL